MKKVIKVENEEGGRKGKDTQNSECRGALCFLACQSSDSAQEKEQLPLSVRQTSANQLIFIPGYKEYIGLVSL